MTSQAPGAVVHGTFQIERVYPAAPRRVFAAFADPALKRRWFAEGEGWVVDSYAADFRPGGREITRFRQEGSAVAMENETIYLDIVDERRIVFAYAMTAGGARLSASLATVEIAAEGRGSRLVFTEQGAFFDGAGSLADREEGSRWMLGRLGEVLELTSEGGAR